MLAIIGGSIVQGISILQGRRREVVRTPYGEPSSAVSFAEIGGQPVLFLARHGYGLNIPPHRVNYRANLWALKSVGATDVLSLATAGAIDPRFVPGSFAIPDQIIDYTYGRESTCQDCEEEAVQHLDFTHPYCAAMRARCTAALTACGETFLPQGVYATTQGPRLETAAEVERIARDGADMIGMTAMPEAYLARELGLCYAAITISVNWAAGRGDSHTAISIEDMQKIQSNALGRIEKVLQHIVTT